MSDARSESRLLALRMQWERTIAAWAGVRGHRVGPCQVALRFTRHIAHPGSVHATRFHHDCVARQRGRWRGHRVAGRPVPG